VHHALQSEPPPSSFCAVLRHAGQVGLGQVEGLLEPEFAENIGHVRVEAELELG
jgi:hypothetical protein